MYSGFGSQISSLARAKLKKKKKFLKRKLIIC